MTFEGLAKKAANYYKMKGVPADEAREIGKRIAGRINADYVHHYKGWKKHHAGSY